MNLVNVLKSLGENGLAKHAAAHDESYSFNDRDSTLISFVKALVKSANDQNVTDHVRFWGVQNKCAELKAKYDKLTTVVKLASHEFALPQQGKLAMVNEDDVLNSSVALYDSRKKLSYEDRNEAATNLLKRAEELDVILPTYVDNYLHKAAGFGVVNVNGLADYVIDRDQKIHDNHDLRGEFDKVASVLNELNDNPDLRAEREFIKTACAAADLIDSEYGNDSLIEEYLFTNDDIVPSLIKKASAPSVKLVNGLTIKLAHISKEALNAIDPDLARMNDDELQSVLPTLPREDADLLSRLI
jgi:hypothetical protein